jgi:hypothetical protein
LEDFQWLKDNVCELPAYTNLLNSLLLPKAPTMPLPLAWVALFSYCATRIRFHTSGKLRSLPIL